jgi:hypothetical protein
MIRPTLRSLVELYVRTGRWSRRLLGHLFGSGPRRPPVRAFRPRLEALEERTVPSISFAGQQSFAISGESIAATVADVNGDGKADIITANTFASGISVLLNTTPAGGALSFAAHQDFTETGVPVSIAAADLNGDEKLDLILSDRSDNSISVLLNTTPAGGALSFAARQTFTASYEPYMLTTGDVDGDGRTDVIVADDLTDKVSVFLNMNSAAGFGLAAEQQFDTGGGPQGIAAADINRDGKLDLVVSNWEDGTISVLRNTTLGGTLGFAPQQTFAIGSRPYTVVTADVNGDGKPDVLVADAASDAVSVLLDTTPTGGTTLSFTTDQRFGNDGGFAFAVAAADFNGDGRPDIAIVNNNGSIDVRQNTTAKNASAPSFAALTSYSVVGNTYGIATGDLDGDGLPDVVATSQSNSTISVLLNTSPGVAGAKSVVSIAQTNLTAGQGVTVTLQAKDAGGNNETAGGDLVTFGLGNGTASGTFSTVIDNNNGTYTVTFTPTVTGNNTITAIVNGHALTTTLPTFTVAPGPFSLANSVVTVSPSSVQAGATSTVKLQAKDAYGNNETTGGLTVGFSLGSGVGKGTFGAVTDNHDGTYTATFTGTTAGVNTVTATINGQLVTTTAPSVTVTPGTASQTASVVTLSSGSIAAGGTVTVTLRAKDAFGNNLTAGGLTVAFALGAGTAGGSFSNVVDHSNGTYDATFTASTAGKSGVNASFGGQSVTTTPPVLTVTPGAASAATSVVTVSPGTIVTAGATTVKLQAKDAFGNNLTTGGLSYGFALGSGSAGGSFSNLTDNNNGTYTATFTGGATGTSVVTATLGGNTVGNPGLVNVVPGSVSLNTSTVTLSSATDSSGMGITVTLRTRDAGGNNLTGGGLSVAFALVGGTATGNFTAVTDNGDGTYTATFTGVLAGTNAIKATIGGSGVSAQPAVTVTPGAPSGATSTLSVGSNSFASGTGTTVTLRAKDAAGNDEANGGLNVAFSYVAGAGGSGTFSGIADNGDGTYTATFTGVLAGNGSIHATFNGKSVTSNQAVTITVGNVNLTTSAVTLSSNNVTAGNTVTVTLQAKDYGGNLVGGGLTVAFALGAGGADGSFGAVLDHGDGTYTADFTGVLAGTSTITAAIFGVGTVNSAPPTITVAPGTADAAASVVTAAPGSITAGGAAAVKLQVKDAYGNNLKSGGLSVTFGLGAGAGYGTLSGVMDHGDGTYTATFTASVAGAKAITASIGGSAVASSPAVYIAPGALSLSNSAVSLSAPSVAAGAAITVTLRARDSYGNLLGTGGLTVAFSLGGGAGQGTFGAVTDNGDGTYTSAFTGTLAGGNTITAFIGGNPITSAAPAVTVTPGAASAAASVVSINPGTIQAGVTTTTVKLQAKDANGNNLTAGGAAVSFALGGGSAQGVFSSVADNGDGTYTATLSGTVAGANTVTAVLNGTPVTTAAPTVTVTPGPVSLAKSLVTVVPDAINAGATSTVKLQARDQFGNILTTGGLSVAFALGAGSAKGTFSTITDNHDGTYTATFTGTAAGSAPVVGRIGGSPVTSAASVVTVKSAYEAASFAGAGVWQYSQLTQAWRQLSTADAAALAANASGQAAGQFGSAGVWLYTPGAGWAQLTTANATGLGMDAAGDVVGRFGSAGVWEFSSSSGWAQLSAANATAMAVDQDGRIVGEFQNAGVWMYTPGTGWAQLSTSNASLVAISGGVVAAEFSGYGVWRYQVGAWQQLLPADATALAADAAGDVAAQFQGAGVWLYSGTSGAWSQMSPAQASGLALDAAGDLLGVFASGGLWRYEAATGWKQLTASVPAQIAVGG